jgi:NADH-quinone oxidoreductase E subunit
MTFHPKIDYRDLHRSARQLPYDDGQPFAYTEENRARLEEIARRYPPEGRRSAILPALYLVQRQLGFVSLNAITHVAEVIGCTAADVEDVVSYYTMFYTRPVGKYVLQVCRTLPCALRGAERVTEELVSTLGIEPNGTDPSGTFTLVEVECLGACDRAPVILVNDAWAECVSPDDAAHLVADLRARGESALTGCHHEAPDKTPRTPEP